ncbi:MAG: GNAT family N-acetyltransferase [Theionarchaea archaeon]|nr:GNAT family N-acetyltransferase [Theionarchaea archaeon]MBU7001927.1 GNAT family N-acetyltransferase [Theionarchaea archaeon]MBU7020414.1 GNAT family N-acetyltransferase [Theionarchaea archaeon]
MDIEYTYGWKEDCSSLFDHLITSAEEEFEFAEWWRSRKELLVNGDIGIIIAAREGVPAGFVTYLVQDGIGKLEACHVLDMPEKQAIAVGLLERGVNLLRSRHDLEDVSGELYYIAGPVDPLAEYLRKAGASVYIRVGMIKALDDVLPEPELPEGYSLREWTLSDIPDVAAFFCQAFKDSIDLVFWEHFRQHEMAVTYIENVARSTVWSHIPMTNAVIVHNGQMCAATLCGVPEKDKGAIYIGVIREHRRKNLGSFLLTQALTAYKKADFRTVGLEVTLHNTAGYQFFRKYGFKDNYRLIGYTFSLQ